MRWAFGLAWRFNKKILIMCCVLLSAVSVLPALALTYRQTILAALNRFLDTGEGSMEAILPVIVLFGVITALAGLSNRLNDELIYSLMFDSYYFGMEEILMDSVQKYTMEELLSKDTKDEYYACVLREGSLTDFISGFCALLGKFVGLFSLLLAAFSVSKTVFGISLFYIVLVVGLNLYSLKNRRDNWKKIRDKVRLADYYEGLPFTPDCAKEIRIFGFQALLAQKWKEAYGAVFDHERKNNLTAELYAFASGFGLYLFLAVMIFQSLYAVAGGKMTAEVLLVIFTLCMNLFTAVSGVAQTLVRTDYGLFALERQFRVFGAKAAVEDGLYGKKKEALLGEDVPGNREDTSAGDHKHGKKTEILLREGEFGNKADTLSECGIWDKDTEIFNPTTGADDGKESIFRTEAISFSYKGDKTALEDVSISVKQGETVALVGLNGSGKSTLVKLLLQLYRPASGKIYYMNADYERLEDGFLGNRTGAFFQDYYLFHVPVWENIGFGDIEHVDDRDRIEKALEKGQAKSFVRNLPFGTETFVRRDIVKEGVDFSGGERQKLAVSRAYMSDKDIFIFDEPASMLDPISELEQFMSIRNTVKGKTAILISHRIGFARLADKIIVLDKGKVAEVGTHDELTARNGLYAGMFREQAQWYQKETEEGVCNA